MDLGLPLRPNGSVCVTENLRVVVKEENVNEEVYVHVISFHDEEDKPVAELHCKTETDIQTDVAESYSGPTYSETLQTAAEIEVKKEDDDQDNDSLVQNNVRWDQPWSAGNMDLGLPLRPNGSVCVTENLRVVVKEENVNEEVYVHVISFHDEEDKPVAELHCKTETDIQTDVAESYSGPTYSETLQTAAEIEVKKEDDDQDNDSLVQSASEHPHIMQHQFHGQNDQLNLQLNDGPYYCTICSKSFTAQRDYEKHQQTHTLSIKSKQVTAKKSHQCTHCGKSFTCKSNLKQHVLIHTGEKSNKCAQCEKAFSASSKLKRHMLTHTGEKPHKCDQCGKGFSLLPTLKTHMLTHTGEKPHTCAQCGRSFSQVSNLKSHMQTHTLQKPHTCAQCGKAFARASQLKLHMIIHTGENPHKCAQCEKAFSTSSELKRHMLTHTREKPHKCDQCGKGFSLFSNLKRHLVIHTREKPHKCA
ncbi:uncharacterized protein LOC143120667 isoform X1 [Alosa pseudoharengus]|uniref:uncharacterized protein LOC143120667 isoform X1 n=1 Tax=Alosa pseudoharengus TaxID=34774 RepID=UPI003F89D020